MEWKNTLTRSQSLRSVRSSDDKPAGRDNGILTRTVSVSKLVERYQATTEGTGMDSRENGGTKGKSSGQKNTVPTPSVNGPRERKTSQLKPPKTGEDKWERSLPETSLSRSKSTGSLQNNANVSIEALKARFEMRNNQASTFRVANEAKPSKDVKPVMNGESAKGPSKKARDAPVHPGNSDAKERNAPHTAVTQTRKEKRQTIGGTNVERTVAAQADDKRRSIADFREKSLVPESEIPCVSVKALSALYLSKVATQEAKQSDFKLAQDQSSELGRRIKQMKCKPSHQETCSACLKTVYPMEKMSTDKYVFHKSCFCCKKCKKTLSMINYVPLHGEFYCIFHYRQLFQRKGNYDEGFGHTQHKNRWLLKTTRAESDA